MSIYLLYLMAIFRKAQGMAASKPPTKIDGGLASGSDEPTARRETAAPRSLAPNARQSCFPTFRTLQIASRILLFFQSLEQGFEVTFAKTLRTLALDNFKKESWPVFHWLGEDLEQITFVVAIDQDP